MYSIHCTEWALTFTLVIDSDSAEKWWWWSTDYKSMIIVLICTTDSIAMQIAMLVVVGVKLSTEQK